MKELEYPSKGAGLLHGYRWEPEGTPLAIVQLVHGIAEYMPRYEAFANFLTGQGFLVVAQDHMGHGRSHGTKAKLYFEGGWSAAVDDVYQLLSDTKKEFPKLPYFLFGHSMGSFLSRTLLYRYPDAGLAGAIICGTGWQPSAVLTAGRAVCAIEKKRVGETKSSALLTKLMFGSYNDAFKPARTVNDWLCTDKQVVDRYNADPLCGGAASTNLAASMLQGIAMNQKKNNLRAMPKALPVLFIAGRSDPVGAMGKGVEQSCLAFQKAGMTHVSMQLFEGRHEILNEPNRETVYQAVLRFLEHHLS